MQQLSGKRRRQEETLKEPLMAGQMKEKKRFGK